MSKPVQPEPKEPAGNITALHDGEPPMPVEVAVMAEIVAFNGSSPAHEDLWSRTRQATDMAGQAAAEAANDDDALNDSRAAYRTAQAEHPDRRAPRPRQWLIAGCTLALDGVACVFAAEALGGSQPETFGWAALFLALLGAGEVSLDYYRESHRALWRWIVLVLGAFIALLGVLRFAFLSAVGADGPLAAMAGAALFTVATAGFVIAGYRALRVAETGQTCQARRRMRDCARRAAAAHRNLASRRAERDRLACAYLSRIRSRLIHGYSASQLPLIERAVMAHLTDQEIA